MKKLKIYDFDEVLKREDDAQSCKEIFVNDIRDKLDKYFEEGYPLGETSTIKKLDDNFRWRKGFLYCCSGYPQSGKSEIINYLMILRAKEYDEKILMYSPETNTYEFISNLVRAYIGKNVNPEFDNVCTKDEWNKGLDFINDHFAFLENRDEMPSIKTLIETYQRFYKKGYSCFIIDPLNWVVESNVGEVNMYQYLKLSLTTLKQFAKSTESIMIYVEHPKTPSPVKGKIPKATAFSLAGGTMHFNKVDCMIIMHRLTREDLEDKVSKGEILSKILDDNQENNINFVEFETVKMKSQRLNGTLGSRILQYDFITGQFK
tara:strand:+ start:358 stop:1311 length:954 start_codon:yes stop_codon:yes gene_type:complete